MIDDLEKAVERLRAGDVVAIPTETVYGLAASIESDAGLRRVFHLKKRPFFDPLIVHVTRFAQAKSLTQEWPPLADFLARVFWPGPLTLVLNKSDRVSDLITSGLTTVGIRHPRHPITETLIERLGVPIAAPSANRFGHVSPSTAQHVYDEFPGQDILVLDGGPCEIGLESTVLAVIDSENLSILRPGGITREQILDALKKWSGRVRLSSQSDSPKSPGHTKHHYQPDIPLIIINATDSLSDPALKNRLIMLNAGLRSENDFEKIQELKLNPEPQLAARELYSQMRELENSGASALIVRRTEQPFTNHWEAIWDRLQRAASHDLSS